MSTDAPTPPVSTSELDTPVAGPAIADLERALTTLLRRATLPTVVAARRAAAGVTLDRAAYGAIVVTSAYGPLRLSELARLLGIEVSTASRHVARLEADGHLERHPDPDDARARLLRVTATGEEVLARVRDARLTFLGTALDRWTPADLADLADLLGRFNADLEAAAPVQAAADRSSS